MSLNQIPESLFDANISLRAKWLWILMVKCSKLESAEFWIKQQDYADKLHCSRRSIGRALQELIKAKLLADLNKRHLHRFKTYRLEGVQTSPLAPLQQLERGKKKESKEDAFMRKLKHEAHLLHLRICTPKQPENLGPKAKQLLDAYGNFWKQKFPKLNGQNGNPYIESCIDESIDYMLKNGMHRDPPGFVEIWLKQATEKFCKESSVL